MQEQAAERAEALRRDTEKKIQMEKRATEEFKAKLEQENTRAKAIAESRREDFGKSSERRRDSKADVSESGSGNDESDQSCARRYGVLWERRDGVAESATDDDVGWRFVPVSGWGIFVKRRRKVWVQAAGKVFGTTEFDSRDVKRGVLEAAIGWGKYFRRRAVGKIDGNASETTGNGDGKHESEKGAVQEHLIVRTTRDRENDGSEAISETLRSGLRFDDWRGRGTVGSICRDENSRDVRLGRHFTKKVCCCSSTKRMRF